MRTILFDDGTRWNDPNARWGDPSYVLEPGDAGYVGLVPHKPKPKRRPMKRNSYFPSRTADQIPWLGNYKNKLPGHAATLGLPAGMDTASVADAEWLIYLLTEWSPAIRTFDEAATAALTEAMSGDGTALMSLPGFTAPAGGVAVNTGALNRIFDVVQKVKDSAAYTDAIGLDLGIIGSEKSAPDFNVFAPVLKITRAPAGVTVGWGWQNKAEFLDLIEIQVDRGAGWQLLAFDTTPGYVDTEPIPANPTKWEYRAIYRGGDQRVGQWSAEAAVVVGG